MRCDGPFVIAGLDPRDFAEIGVAAGIKISVGPDVIRAGFPAEGSSEALAAEGGRGFRRGVGVGG